MFSHFLGFLCFNILVHYCSKLGLCRKVFILCCYPHLSLGKCFIHMYCHINMCVVTIYRKCFQVDSAVIIHWFLVFMASELPFNMRGDALVPLPLTKSRPGRNAVIGGGTYCRSRE